MPVTVVAVTVSAPELIINAKPCTVPTLLDHPVRRCEGATLAPGGAGCDIGVILTDEARNAEPGTQYTGLVQLKLFAVCTSKSIAPCTSLGSEHSPSPATPIEVTWTDPGRERTATVPTPIPTDTASTSEASPGPAGRP